VGWLSAEAATVRADRNATAWKNQGSWTLISPNLPQSRRPAEVWRFRRNRSPSFGVSHRAVAPRKPDGWWEAGPPPARPRSRSRRRRSKAATAGKLDMPGAAWLPGHGNGDFAAPSPAVFFYPGPTPAQRCRPFAAAFHRRAGRQAAAQVVSPSAAEPCNRPRFSRHSAEKGAPENPTEQDRQGSSPITVAGPARPWRRPSGHRAAAVVAHVPDRTQATSLQGQPLLPALLQVPAGPRPAWPPQRPALCPHGCAMAREPWPPRPCCRRPSRPACHTCFPVSAEVLLFWLAAGRPAHGAVAHMGCARAQDEALSKGMGLK